MTKGPAPPPPPGAPTTAPESVAIEPTAFGASKGVTAASKRPLIYGPPGIGKSELASMLPAAKFLDVEDGTAHLDVDRVTPPGEWTFALVRAALAHAPLWKGVQSIVIDSLSAVQDLAFADVVANQRNEKNQKVDNIEGFGWGKGYQFVLDRMKLLLADLDAHVRQGRTVCLTAHECVDAAPNPIGEDYIQYQPDLYSARSGKASVRNAVCRWCTDILFINLDVHASDGKGHGSGTRTIYTSQMPSHLAKTRPAIAPIVYTQGSDEIWRKIGCLS